MKALILVGGFGKRLRPYTEKVPKPLVPVGGKPILLWQIEWLKRNGVDEVILATGYLKEKVFELIGSGKKYGIKVAYVVEDEPLGTGGGIKNAEALLKDEEFFFAMNGDIITDIPLEKLKNVLLESPEIVGVLSLVPLPSPYGIVEFDEKSGLIKKFIEKPLLKDYWINAGVYCFRPEIFKYLPEKGDIEKTAFVKLAEEGKLKAVTFENTLWKAIDTHKDIEECERLLKEYNLL